VRVTVVGGNRFNLVELDEDPDHSCRPGSISRSRPPKACRTCPRNTRAAGSTDTANRIEVAAVNLNRLRGPLRALYEELDHRSLNDIPDLNEATSERLCAWIWSKLSEQIDDLLAVVVQETSTARCIYRGE